MSEKTKLDWPGYILKAISIDHKIRMANDMLRGRDINSVMPDSHMPDYPGRNRTKEE